MKWNRNSSRWLKSRRQQRDYAKMGARQVAYEPVALNTVQPINGPEWGGRYEWGAEGLILWWIPSTAKPPA